jgi:hypothetical protein
MERGPMDRQAEDARYVQELGRTLRERNVGLLREFPMRSADERGDAAESAELREAPAAELEIRMHKMITARRDLQDLYEESAEWLTQRGLNPVR